MQQTAPCTPGAANGATAYLTAALDLQPRDAGTWRAVLMTQGLADRAWIADQVRRLRAQSDSASLAAIDQATADWLPPQWTMTGDWSQVRCLAAYRIWTVALIDKTLGRWEHAVAAYQAGIGIAPGRVPDEIIAEYYSALGHYKLAQPGPTAGERLAAAKYLALSGEQDAAATELRASSLDARLTPTARCEAQLGLDWLLAGAPGALPPWPIPISSPGADCEAPPPDPATPDAGWSPQWSLTSSDSAATSEAGLVLIGFDLDADILEAGAEVLGDLYWRDAAGRVSAQPFRRPNLWPNSGNSWLELEGFTTCLSGYVEPPWVTPCASGTAQAETAVGLRSPVGYLHSPWGEYRDRTHETMPDANLVTAGIALPEQASVIYGGRWRVDGSFPRPHIASSAVDGGTGYHSVLAIPPEPQGQWTVQAAVASAPPSVGEQMNWLRPRTGQGAGTLQFDDVFSFALPPG